MNTRIQLLLQDRGRFAEEIKNRSIKRTCALLEVQRKDAAALSASIFG